MYSHECEYCGANLDPGEKCDCQDKQSQRSEETAIHNPQVKQIKKRAKRGGVSSAPIATDITSLICERCGQSIKFDPNIRTCVCGKPVKWYPRAQ